MISSAPIYKIVPRSLWRDAEAKGHFQGAPLDVADGYIHFSTALQVRETASRHFSGEENLLLVGVDPEKLGESLKWEPARGGQLFPHLYGPLGMEAVVFVEALHVDATGYHVFPASIR